ncbi:nickel transport system substrate-binding protein [Dendrosporobacter quercicolus]|uniref:Nickel transport system substrate-binding protein n=1 Tax=Dendrosporobacter quercicolus TaxID=146817 RepID=A0A1G9QVL5_9FIRM|nr:nickel ABC transporter substrate-binding protein [Dendrosporobacter quercicolus]SDM15034.1 nickel transport system substrate-binding protein [Dendrosporobacter quercicolus]
MHLNKIMVLLLVGLLAVAVTGCGSKDTGGKQGKTGLVYASTKDIRNINPHLYGGELAAQNMVFEPLVINTAEGVKPWLAEKWAVSADGKEYTFYLRKDVKFTDGEPFNAEAVKLNFDTVLANGKRHAWLEMVKQIDYGEVIDEFTYKLVLKQPYYPLLEELGLTRPFRFISPKSFMNGTTKDGVNGYVGTGPWILSEHKENQYAVFTANKEYWGAKPKLDTVRWQVMPDHQTILLALQKGEIDLLFGSDGDMIDLDSFNALQKEGKYQAVLSQPIGSRAILLNASRPVTKDLKVREAFQYAIDKKQIAEGILNGTETIADTLLSPTVPYAGVPLPARSFDREKAKRLMDAAGWITGPDGYRYQGGKLCEVTISFNSNNAQERTISEFIQSNLKEIGVKLHILGEEKQAFLDRQKTGEFDLQYSQSWGLPYDPHTYVSSWRLPAHGDYQAQKGIARKAWLDDTVGTILSEQDRDKRQKLYDEILTYVHQESVYLPLTYSRIKAVHVAALKGVTFNPSQYEIAFEKMYFE